MSRTITVDLAVPVRTYSSWYWFKWRLSKRLNLLPEAVTAAWYAQGCPAKLDAGFLTLTERVRWALDKWLRECSKRVAT